MDLMDKSILYGFLLREKKGKEHLSSALLLPFPPIWKAEGNGYISTEPDT